MSLQLALIVLGIATIFVVVMFSYAKQRGYLFNSLISSRVPVTFLHLLKTWVALPKKNVSGGLKSALISAIDFRLDPDPTKSTKTLEDKQPRRPINLRQHRAYTSKANKEYQRILKSDYWARLSGSELAQSHDVLAIYRTHEVDLIHPHRIHGLIYPGNQWIDLEDSTPSDRFYDLIVSAQIVDRNGPINESELTRTNNLVYELSERFNRKLQFDMTMEGALDEAKLLDKFCQQYDVLVIFNIVASKDQQFLGKDLHRLATISNMTVDDMGLFRLLEPESSEIWFTMANQFEPGFFPSSKLEEFATTGLFLFMNLPLVSRPIEALDKMYSTAKLMSLELSGTIKTLDGADIDTNEIDKIRQQIIEIADVFHRVGILPGSEVALRLF